MATITVQQARYLGNKFGVTRIQRGGEENPDIKETASQSYGLGSPVYYDSNGTIALATATSNIVNPFAGLAIKKATGTTGALARYEPVQAGDRFIMNLKGTSTVTTALTQAGKKYHLDLSSGNLVVNPDASFDATKPFVLVEGLYTTTRYADGDAVGDTNGRVVVWFPSQQGLQG